MQSHKMKTATSRQSYIQTSLILMLLFASWGIWWSFFQIWLTSKDQGLGLNGSNVGLIFTTNSFVTLIFVFIYGVIQDKLQLKRGLLIVCSCLSTLVAPFFIWVFVPLIQHTFGLAIAVGSIFLSSGFLAAIGLFEAVSEKMSRTYHFNYGQARAWGTFGYAIVALIAGFIFNINPYLNFWLGSVLGLVLLLVLSLWKTVPQTSNDSGNSSGYMEPVPSITSMLFLLKVKDIWKIIIFTMFSWSFYTIFEQQMFPEFYTDLFSSASLGHKAYGTINSIQVFFEAIMMGVVPLIMHKIGVKRTILIGVSIMFIRIGVSSIISSPYSASVIKMFQALEIPFFVLPMFRYITLHFDTKLSAVIYMIGYNVSAQIGQVILSSPLGILRDHLGYQPTFFVIAIIICIAGIFGYFTLRKDDDFVYGDVFNKS
ncbi:oligosaccharide MFS transporter [Staphylococcus simiae]|uniref:oligosaccharide MFS transporter n=2 Tax=Staphylococcus simiae TaxID=308354 RepID=UPI001F6217B7|nr:oligosaccharide MFS transporter [Staphylococcus simiae]